MNDPYDDWYLVQPEEPMSGFHSPLRSHIHVPWDASLLDEPMDASYRPDGTFIVHNDHVEHDPSQPTQSDDQWTAEGWSDTHMWPSDTIDDDGERLPEITPRDIVDGLYDEFMYTVHDFYAGKIVDPEQVANLGMALASAIRNAQEG